MEHKGTGASALWGERSPIRETDPEFYERLHSFLAEAADLGDLDGRIRHLAVLAALLGCQGLEAFQAAVGEALSGGVSPVELKETVYQAVPYLGLGRVYPFLEAVNEILTAQGVPLPLPGQATTTPQNRMEAGNQAQVDIFGPAMRGFQNSGPEASRHINRWLAANCFGDYYTRKGLTYREREMLTFCFLAALGDCEPQLESHAAANLRLGNSREYLIQVLSQCLPYIGYPRSLNALHCLNEAAGQG